MITTNHQTDISKLFSKRSQEISTSFIREILAVTQRPEVISFAGGLPNPDLFPNQALSESAQRVLQHQSDRALQYCPTPGLTELRTWIANRYSKTFGFEIGMENILITTGSQQAVDLIGRLFINKGDQVLMESPGYLGAIQSLSTYGADYIPLPLEYDGPSIEDFKNLCQYNPIKLMYSVPNYQNPTGISYSDEKRKCIAETLRHMNAILIEDDPYQELYFETPPPAPIKKYLGDQSIITGSFSKMIAPGMRIGWIIAEENIIKQLSKLKQATDLHSSTINQYMLMDYLEHNNIDEHLQKCRNYYRTQKNHMIMALESSLSSNIKMTKPDGGMVMWIDLPNNLNTFDLLELCMKDNLVFVPGSTFFTNNQGKNGLRLTFSNNPIQEIDKGIQILCHYIESMLNK